MKKKLFLFCETGGFITTALATVLLWNVYGLTGENLVGALFGSVNLSIWEQVKPMLLCYMFCGLVELVVSKPYFRQFVVAKFVGLYSVLLSYIGLRSMFMSVFSNNVNIIITIVSLACGYFVSCILTVSHYPLRSLFPTACFMILLLFVLCFSFTAFPPAGMLFADPITNLYGIVPDYIDVGAIILNNMYY